MIKQMTQTKRARTLLVAALSIFSVTFGQHYSNRPNPSQSYQTPTETPEFIQKWETIFATEVANDPKVLADRFTKAIQINYQTSRHLKDHPFYLGASSSAYQFEGGIEQEDAMHDFYTKRGLPLPGIALDFWNNYEQIIKEMASTGMNSFRMSISWSRIEPQEGKVNYAALQHYGKIVDCLRQNGMEALVVLHHYTIPSWFANKEGFEKAENNNYFVKFGKKVYAALYDKVTYWSTFNAIEGYAAKGYLTLEGPPSNPGNLYQRLTVTAQVMANMLEAHVQFFEAIKGNPQKEKEGLYHQLKRQNPNIPTPQIGIQKNIIPIDPSTESWTAYYIGKIKGLIGNKVINEGFYNFFATGTFDTGLGPLFTQNTNHFAPQTLDWIGVNTYSNRYEGGSNTDPEELRTENPNYRFYPEGIDRAVKEVYERIVEPINQRTNRVIPMWITENGIATKEDAAGTAKRTLFYKRALLVITKLIEEEYPIIGYTPWASHDNYEWGSQPGQKRYGMFYVDFNNPTAPHSLKPGAQYYIDFVKAVLKPKI